MRMFCVTLTLPVMMSGYQVCDTRTWDVTAVTSPVLEDVGPCFDPEGRLGVELPQQGGIDRECTAGTCTSFHRGSLSRRCQDAS